jgi:hypothetical protein
LADFQSSLRAGATEDEFDPDPVSECLGAAAKADLLLTIIRPHSNEADGVARFEKDLTRVKNALHVCDRVVSRYLLQRKKVWLFELGTVIEELARSTWLLKDCVRGNFKYLPRQGAGARFNMMPAEFRLPGPCVDLAEQLGSHFGLPSYPLLAVITEAIDAVAGALLETDLWPEPVNGAFGLAIGADDPERMRPAIAHILNPIQKFQSQKTGPGKAAGTNAYMSPASDMWINSSSPPEQSAVAADFPQLFDMLVAKPLATAVAVYQMEQADSCGDTVGPTGLDGAKVFGMVPPSIRIDGDRLQCRSFGAPLA